MKHQSLTSINENGFLNMNTGELSTCYGFYDWFCSDQSLINRSKRLLTKANKVVKMLGLDPDDVTVAFKNCCPVNGPTYDLIWFINIHSNEHLFTLVPKCSHSEKCELYIDNRDLVNNKLLTICDIADKAIFETYSDFLKLIR